MNIISRQGCDHLALSEGAYVARLVPPDNLQEVKAYQQLRYSYFVCQKGWVTENPCQLGHEVDCYDPYAQHLAVFEGDEIVAYLRLLDGQAESGFMLDTEFNCLLSDEGLMTLPRQGAVELSRLVVAPTLCCKRASHQVIEVLLKLLYHLSLEQHIERYYIVVEEAWLKVFPRRFHVPFQAIGKPFIFPDGTVTRAAYTTLACLEQAISSHDPQKYAWYRQCNVHH